MSETLKRIKSFDIDHTKMTRGLYYSRIDTVRGVNIYTYDLRVCEPNKTSLDGAVVHTIEHFIATYLRDKYRGIIYFGPMGCLTGFYLICIEPDAERVKQMVISALQFIIDYQGPVIGGTEKECGNYRYHNLSEAKDISKAYLEVLNNTTKYDYEF